MLLMPMRYPDSSMHKIDGFDLAMKERHATQQFAEVADDIGDVEIARGHLVEHRGEEKKLS